MPQNQPMYRFIADDLRAKIEDGRLEPGAKLSTEGDLSDEYSASRNTVREAIRRLTDEGLLESRPGQGTFVAQQIDPFVTVLSADPQTGFGGGEGATYLSRIREVHRNPRNTIPRVEVVTASDAVARLLGIEQGSQVVSRSQERYIDEIPWSKQTTFYLMDFITKGATDLLMAKDIEGGAVPYLADKIGVRQTQYQDVITGRLAAEDEQAFFRISHNAAVFVHSRIAFDQDNTPMRLTVTIFPVDRNQLIVNVGPNAEPNVAPLTDDPPGR
jgi:GntR family transcriptional regulator